MSTTIKIVFLAAAAMAIMIIALSSMSISFNQRTGHPYDTVSHEEPSISMRPLLIPSRRVSRFLAQNENYGSLARNPKAADHCNKDNEICNQLAAYGKNSTCCNNKCMDLNEDDKNCGACKNKCKFTQHCCNGYCVDLSYDKRHCGSCYNKCLLGRYCVYGMCDYA